MNTAQICENALCGKNISREEIVYLLKTAGSEYETLREYARKVRKEYVGNVVHLRGLIEFSNICICDCRYCGIRKSNSHVSRYMMSKEEILDAAEFSWKAGFGSVVLQSGERRDEEFINFVADAVKEIKNISNGELGITLSCGVQSAETYKYWKECGADRYLLRIETTNEKLFSSLHPDGNFEERKRALFDLKKCGYITGTGIMTGLPNQTEEMLAKDVEFFRELDADMIGLGPYVTCEDVELEEFGIDNAERQKERLMLSYKMIAVCRVLLKNVNIASATALSALDQENGRVEGLLSGANVIMPNAGTLARRKNYNLYNNKPDTAEPVDVIRDGIKKSGCTIELFTQGNPPR